MSCNTIAVASLPIHAFLGSTIFLSSRWLLSNIIIVKTMDKGERGMNLVATTIINPQRILAKQEIKPATSRSQVQYATY